MLDDDDFLDGGDDNFSDDNFSDEAGDGEEEGDGSKTAEEWYYEGKSLENDNAEGAKDCYVHTIEEDKDELSEYGFKAHKRIIMMMVRGKTGFVEDEFESHFKEMMSFRTQFDVKTVEKVLDAINETKKWALIEKVADDAARFFSEKNERSWFRTYAIALKWLTDADAESLLSAEQSSWIASRLDELEMRCMLAPGVNNPKKESFLLEVLALRMKRILFSAGKGRSIAQMIKGRNGLRRLVYRAKSIHSEILGLGTLGIIHECCGVVMLADHKWSDAKQNFFEAFKNYDDSASPRRLPCLRLFVLASLLENSGINPFESREIKSLSTNEEIMPVVSLWNAFESRNVADFNTALEKAFEKDEFAREFASVTILAFRRVKIAEIVQAYNKVRISFIADKLQIPVEQCNALITELILDGRLSGSIDQTKMVLCMEEGGVSEDDTKYIALSQWSNHIEEIAKCINKKVVGTARDTY